MIIYLQTIGIRSNKTIIIRIFNLLTQIIFFLINVIPSYYVLYKCIHEKDNRTTEKDIEKIKHNQIIHKIIITMNNSRSFNCVLILTFQFTHF